MKANLYVDVRISPSSNYIHIENYLHELIIEEEYKKQIEFSKQWNHDKAETLEGYKLRFLFLEVEFDGRKRNISDEDILKSMVKQGYATPTGAGSIFGGFYYPTEKLTQQLDDQLNQRKELIKQGIYVNLKEIA